MATRDEMRAPGSIWVAVAGIAVLAVVVAVLAFAAYDHANPTMPPATAAPVPTFTLGVQTGTPNPTPTPTPTPTGYPRDQERFFAVGSGAMWRATSGSCTHTPPLVERSADGGQTWADVTPHYRGITQVASLDAFAGIQADMVSGIGGGCDTQALRTFTQGQFWDSYPDVLAASHYVDVFDAAVVHTPGGPIAAPCPDARSLRAALNVVALVCDGTAYLLSATTWTPLPADSAAAVAVAAGNVWVAHTAAGCSGLAIARFDPAAPAAGTQVACAPDAATALAPVALASSGGTLYLWSGSRVSEIPQQ